MVGLFIVIHSLACVLLIVLILMQSGRGGGLTEAFSSAESMFGAKTNEFMVRATTVCAFVFLITSLSLAYFSAKRERSLIPAQVMAEQTSGADTGVEKPASTPPETNPPETKPAETKSAQPNTAEQ